MAELLGEVGRSQGKRYLHFGGSQRDGHRKGSLIFVGRSWRQKHLDSPLSSKLMVPRPLFLLDLPNPSAKLLGKKGFTGSVGGLEGSLI